MRSVMLAAILAAGLAFAATPASSAQIDAIGIGGFTVTNGQPSGSGTLGGVNGTITSTVAGGGDCSSSCNGNWVMTVGGASFAGGTFTCDPTGCVYIGRINVADSNGFAIATTTLSIGTVADAAIWNHAMWVGDVTAWANANPAVIASLSPSMTIADFISGASSDNGHGM